MTASFEDKIGYRFSDGALLQTALTHSSAGADSDYERLEFLGDRVLGLVMAQLLYEIFPGENEGHLAKRHAALVEGSMLSDIARNEGLGAFINLSDAERAAGGGDNDNILSDSLEAVFGALYMEAGLAVCHTVIKKLWGDRIHIMKDPPRDPKTALQEWAQGEGLPLPLYEITDREGPDHAPQFEITVTVQGFSPVSAKGASRRAAEKEAARLLLEQMAGVP